MMNTSINTRQFAQSARKLAIIVMMAFVLQHAHADNYITFNDGHLVVFPDTCILGITSGNGLVTVTDRNGGTYSYSSVDISSIDNQLIKVLPQVTSYKFDNKYN